jgi:hypothetical protein
VAKVRVPRTGVTPEELASVLTRRLGAGFQVVADKQAANGEGEVLARRTPLSAAVVRIGRVPGATVFRVRGVGMPVVSAITAHAVVDALRRSPEFRSV